MRSPSKNMCSVRHRPMPVAPNASALAVCSGLSALVRTCHLASPGRTTSSAGRTSGTWRFEARIQRLVDQHLHDFRRGGLELARRRRCRSCRRSTGKSPSLNVLAVDRAPSWPRSRPARSAAPQTHTLPICRATRAACDETPPRAVKDSLGGDHAAQILGAGLDRGPAAPSRRVFRRLDGPVGVEINLARRRPGAGRQAGGDHLRRSSRPHRDRKSGPAPGPAGRPGRGSRPSASRSAFPSPSRSRCARGQPGPLAVARLQHEQLAVLDRELEVLHVLEVGLQASCEPSPARRTLWAARPLSRATGSGVRTPATTSSPWAFIRNSP